MEDRWVAQSSCARFYRGHHVRKGWTAFTHLAKAGVVGCLRNTGVGGQCAGGVPVVLRQRFDQMGDGFGAAEQPQGSVVGCLAGEGQIIR